MLRHTRYRSTRMPGTGGWICTRLCWPREHIKTGFHASLLLAQGVSMKAVQKTLGHSGIRTTMNTYGHLYEEERKAVAAKMDAIFNGVAPNLAPSKAIHASQLRGISVRDGSLRTDVGRYRTTWFA